MTAIPAAHPRKAVVQVAAVKVAIDHLPDIGSEKPVPALEALKMILHALVVRGVLRLSRTIKRL